MRRAPAPEVVRLLAAQGLRAAGYGFTAVILGGVLSARSYPPVAVGLLLAAMVAGTTWLSVLVGMFADRWGRRRSYAGLYLLLAASGLVFALVDWYPALLAVALAGMLSTDVIDNGPATTIEQAILAGHRRPDTRRFGAYNAVAALAGSLGALAAGLPGLTPDAALFLLLVPIGLAGALIAVGLPVAVEIASDTDGAARPGLSRSRTTVSRLAALFAVDAFAGGFIVQSFIAYWLTARFDLPLTSLGPLFFTLGLAQTISFLLAPRLAQRFGLLPVMVFTHLPSNLLLAAVAFAPTYPVAAVLLLARGLLSQMDVPTRQAYVMALVDVRERTAAAAVTNAARYTVRPLGPLLAGLAAGVAPVAPFLVAGALKSGYDLTLWAWFRRVPLADQPAPTESGQPRSHEADARPPN
jgi:MFS family permease